ncbi:WD40 repeat-like protein [Phlebopus sp. FC_14]|nr:WD40 repeat-like protein [Phlebopus sp. FC_14]
MHILQSGQSPALSASVDSVSEAGPSSFTLDKAARSNGFTNGFSVSKANNTNNGTSPMSNGESKHTSAIARVSLPGTTLYEDPYVDREEFVRLVLQSLRDIGYIESAATLEAESGYTLESQEVSEFRQYILNAEWSNAATLLPQLAVADEETLLEAKFLIGRQKYLELLEARKTTTALQVLRNELAPLSADPEQLHALSSFIMCSDPEDLRRRASWDGVSGLSRQTLLSDLQQFIPSATMIPQRRFAALLTQSRFYQRERCIYHNTCMNATSFSLFANHHCDKEGFPRVTTTILDVHTDEVWNLAWSHDGLRLASACKDKSAIIWRIGSDTEPTSRDCAVELTLREHPFPVGALAWSLDDSILATSADNLIKLWDTKTGSCVHTIDSHLETVSALVWLPDGSGFMSASLDRKIASWDMTGKPLDQWSGVPIRVTDMAVSPDMKWLVTIGMGYTPPTPSLPEGHSSRVISREPTPPVTNNGGGIANGQRSSENRMMIYDLKTKAVELSFPTDGELTSVKVSDDSQYALINHAPDEIHLWDLKEGRLARKFTGQRQGHHVIRSCFGGIDGNFVVSGSEDRNVYVWHRDTGVLLEALPGHGMGSVNSVSWNPRNERMFASCSDDHTIRIWEPLPDVRTVAPTGIDNGLNGKGKGKGRTSSYWRGLSDGAS